MAIDLDVIFLFSYWNTCQRNPILYCMGFYQLSSSLQQYYHKHLEYNLRQNSISFYENEVFGEIQRLPYQRAPCHHQNKDAYSNDQCHICLIDHFLYL